MKKIKEDKKVYSTLAIKKKKIGNVWGKVVGYCADQEPRVLLGDWLVDAIRNYAKKLGIIDEEI